MNKMHGAFLKKFLQASVFPVVLLYCMAFFGFISFDSSGWLLPGLIILAGVALILLGADFFREFFKKKNKKFKKKLNG